MSAVWYEIDLRAAVLQREEKWKKNQNKTRHYV